jgi:LPPG:FO 2-phospho-L-lactate transferase
MADKCLAAIDVECTAAGVGGLYGSTLLDSWLVDTSDADTIVDGVKVVSTPLWMTDESTTAEMASIAIESLR